jgi:hypothetical protein
MGCGSQPAPSPKPKPSPKEQFEAFFAKAIEELPRVKDPLGANSKLKVNFCKTEIYHNVWNGVFVNNVPRPNAIVRIWCREWPFLEFHFQYDYRDDKWNLSFAGSDQPNAYGPDAEKIDEDAPLLKCFTPE